MTIDELELLKAERNLYRAWIAEMAVMSTQAVYKSKAQALLDEGDEIAYEAIYEQAKNMGDASTRKDEGIQGNCASENTSSAANTALVKKLVEALKSRKHIDAHINVAHALINQGIDISIQALTEAQAWLERQEGKASELVDDSPMYPDTEEYRQFNLWAATQGGNIDQCNYEAWKAGYRDSSRLERQGKCGEGA